MGDSLRYAKKVKRTAFFQIFLIADLIAFFLTDITSTRIDIIAQLAIIVRRFSLGYLLAIVVLITGILLCHFKIRIGDSINYLIPYTLFTIITIVLQLCNGFRSYCYRDLITLFVPVLIYICFINIYTEKREFNVDIIFYLLILFFVMFNLGTISFSNIRAIDFINSYSAFESKYAYYGLVLQFYYAYKKDTPKMIVSFIICVLSLKRVAFLFAILLLVFHKKIPLDKPVKKSLVIWTMALFLAAPVLIQIMCNEAFGNWFSNLTGLNLNAFVSGRISKFNAVFDSGEMKYGWGSSTIYLTNNPLSFSNYQGYGGGEYINIHSDILRMYCECYIFGLFTFLHYHLKQVRDNWMSFLLMLYLLTDMLVNHHLGIGKVLLWIIVYIVIHEMKNDKKSQVYSQLENDAENPLVSQSERDG